MSANLTPQYHKAEEAYRRATSAEEELAALEAMLVQIPKHKGTEKLQSDIKQKVSKARKDLQTERRRGRRAPGVRIVRQGAGTAALLGGPNAGKSQLVSSLSRAHPEVAPYPFTTRTPSPGMMPWQDVMVQLIDTPPITADYFEPYMYGLIRGADLALLLVDLGSDDGITQCQEVLDKLAGTKTQLGRTSHLDEHDIGLSFTQTYIVPNKIDLDEAAERLALLHELLPLDFPEYVVSASEGTGLDQLREAIYNSLDVIRVYTKLPSAKQPDFARPYTVRRDGTVHDVAEQIHNDFIEQFKFARVWGSHVHDGTVVKGDHVLYDKDVVEIHV